MGCVNSKSSDSKAARIARWRSTGIVALRDSKLKTFPDEVLDLDRSVRILDLTRNKIVDIPMEISKLTNLQRLVLDGNLIEHLPMNLGKLQALKFLSLDGNRIYLLPDELGLLVRLERVSISGNLLSCLPQTIGSLRNLSSLLNVSKNNLTSLESIGCCFSLEEIEANDNSIEEIPASVCSGLNDSREDIGDNMTLQSEDSTSSCKPVFSLLGKFTEVSKIPPNLLKECKVLQNIYLHDNPILMDQFHQMEGFEEFEARRKRKFDKQIDSNVMISSKGLDEGVDL